MGIGQEHLRRQQIAERRLRLDAIADNPGIDAPWLLLPKKAGSDAGVLGPAAFVQRLHTKGGAVGNQPRACDTARWG